MALKDTNPNEEYPYFFMDSQSIHQRVPEVSGGNPEYELSIVWKQYKFSAEGEMIFKPDSQVTYYDDSFYVTAGMEYAGGDSTHFNTLSAQIASIKRLIETELSVSLEIV